MQISERTWATQSGSRKQKATIFTANSLQSGGNGTAKKSELGLLFWIVLRHKGAHRSKETFVQLLETRMRRKFFCLTYE